MAPASSPNKPRLTCLTMLLACCACTELADFDDREDAGVDVGSDATDASIDAPVDTAPDADPCIVPPTGCPPLCARERVVLGSSGDSGERIIAVDTTLTCDNLYAMTTATFVEPGATLTVEAGVIIEASSRGLLLVQPGGRLVADGTAEEPVVFRSVSPDPSPGSWAGVVMLGDAPVLVDGGGNGSRVFSPFPEERATYGGDEPTHDCGSLRYVRIEHAGILSRVFVPTDIAALMVAGCGTQSSFDFIQIHAPAGESTLLIGGGFPLRHAVFSESQGDALNWDRGWTGSVQHLVVHMAFDNDNNAIEGRISELPFPSLQPAIANATLINPYREGREAMYLTTGSGMRAFNIIVLGSAGGLIVWPGTRGNPGFFNTDFFTVENSIFEPSITVATDSDVGARIDPPLRGNRSVDPMLPAGLLVDDLHDPDFRPAAGGPASTGAAAALPSELELTDYVGAIDPAGDDWTLGWTQYDP